MVLQDNADHIRLPMAMAIHHSHRTDRRLLAIRTMDIHRVHLHSNRVQAVQRLQAAKQVLQCR